MEKTVGAGFPPNRVHTRLVTIPTEEATKTKNGAELYAEQVLNKLEISLAQQQQEIKNAQIYMEKLRADSFGNYDVPTSYSYDRPQATGEYSVR